MIKSFSGQVVFCFAILRAISAYVGENWLSQYMVHAQELDVFLFYTTVYIILFTKAKDGHSAAAQTSSGWLRLH